MQKAGLSRSQAYARISQTANRETLPRDLAAIKLGAEVGININKFATAEQLALLRQAGTPVTPPPAISASVTRTGNPKPGKGVRSSTTPNSVFVIHGRDDLARGEMFTFLRAIGIAPIEWPQALAYSKKASPFIQEILDSVFAKARAVIVLLTPDDLVYLRPELTKTNDPALERTPMGQARPNVLFEAGMAIAKEPGRTVFVQVGNVKEFSDIRGRHVVRMTNEFGSRNELVIKLRNAGCQVNTTGADWVTAGDFSDPLTRSPKDLSRRTRKKKVTKKSK